MSLKNAALKAGVSIASYNDWKEKGVATPTVTVHEGAPIERKTYTKKIKPTGKCMVIVTDVASLGLHSKGVLAMKAIHVFTAVDMRLGVDGLVWYAKSKKVDLKALEDETACVFISLGTVEGSKPIPITM